MTFMLTDWKQADPRAKNALWWLRGIRDRLATDFLDHYGGANRRNDLEYALSHPWATGRFTSLASYFNAMGDFYRTEAEQIEVLRKVALQIAALERRGAGTELEYAERAITEAAA